MRVLVTGGAGFIGSHLVEALLKRGDEVVVLDNFSSGKKENLQFPSPLGSRLEIIEGTTSESKAAQASVKGVDIVFHQAAVGSVVKSVEDPRRSHHANITGTLELLIAAKDAGVKRFVNAASSSGYGDTPELPKHEAMVPNPLSPYAATKVAQEHYCRAFSASYGLETVSLRYFNVFGPRQDPHSDYAAVIPRFFHAFIHEQRPIIYGDGEQTRDFTFIADVVDANLLAAGFQGARGEVFNIAGGRSISINELATKIAKIIGSRAVAKHTEARAGDVRHSLADISRAKDRLKFSPRISLDQGLELAATWYRSNLKR